MSLNHSVRVEPVGDLGAVVLDFEAHRARRQQLRLEAAAPGAAMALARCEVGRGDWRELMAALIAPFNP